MAPHQGDVVVGETFREIAALLHVGDKQVGVTKLIGDIPNRHIGADEAAGMNHGTKRRRLRDAERQNVFGMGMDDRLDIRTRFVDGGVNEPLEIKRAFLLAHWLPVEAQFDDIARLDQFGRDRAGEEKMLWIVGMANAHMAVSIHDLLAREDAIGDDEVLNDGIKTTHGLLNLKMTRPSGENAAVS